MSSLYQEFARNAVIPWRHSVDAWKRSLLRCLPRLLAHHLASKRPVLVITPSDETAELSRSTFGDHIKLGTFSLSDLQNLDRSAKTLSVAGFTAIWIEVPEQQMLYRQIRLPVQVAKNLRQAVQFEIDRITPFSSKEIFFDVSIKGTIAQGSKLDLLVAFCRRTDVEGWLQAVSAAGGAVTKISSSKAWAGANLLPPESRSRASKKGLLATTLIATLPALLLTAILLTPILQRNNELTLLQGELQRSRSLLAEKEKLTESLDQVRKTMAEVFEAKRNQAFASELMLKLTTLLPDTTYLLTMEYRDSRLDIRGESDNAATLIGLLENAPEFDNVKFRSPVTTVSGREKERFHIELNVRPVERE